jgi:cell division transport system permease protein
VEVSVFLCPTNSDAPTCAGGEASEAQINEVRSLLDVDLADQIQKVYFESKQDAYKSFHKRYPDGYLGTQLTANDMQASFRLKLTNPENYSMVSDVLTGRPGVEVVEDQRRVFDSLFLALDRATLLSAGLAAVMLLAAGMLIATTIRLSALSRRRETSIMRLVGASNTFIQLPFMLEGAIAAVVGALLAVGGLWLGVKYLITDWLQVSVTWVAYVGGADVMKFAPILIIVAFVLAAVSSLITLNKYLRV